MILENFEVIRLRIYLEIEVQTSRIVKVQSSRLPDAIGSADRAFLI